MKRFDDFDGLEHICITFSILIAIGHVLWLQNRKGTLLFFLKSQYVTYLQEIS